VLKRTMGKDILAAIDSEIATLEQVKALLSASDARRQAQTRPAREGCFSCCSEGSEDPEAPQDERRSAGAHPAGADQALGCIKRNSKGKEECGESCLTEL